MNEDDISMAKLGLIMFYGFGLYIFYACSIWNEGSLYQAMHMKMTWKNILKILFVLLFWPLLAVLGLGRKLKSILPKRSGDWWLKHILILMNFIGVGTSITLDVMLYCNFMFASMSDAPWLLKLVGGHPFLASTLFSVIVALVFYLAKALLLWRRGYKKQERLTVIPSIVKSIEETIAEYVALGTMPDWRNAEPEQAYHNPMAAMPWHQIGS